MSDQDASVGAVHVAEGATEAPETVAEAGEPNATVEVPAHAAVEPAGEPTALPADGADAPEISQKQAVGLPYIKPLAIDERPDPNDPRFQTFGHPSGNDVRNR